MSVTRAFTSMNAFAAHLLVRQALVVAELRTGLKFVTTAIKDTAQAELGHYQSQVGPFEAWKELADATKEDRVSQGFTENDPLLRSGALKESINDEVVALDGYVGSDNDEAVWMELGTDKAPPRSYLGPAVIHNEDLIKEVLGAALVTGILGSGVKSITTMTSKLIK